MKNEKLIEHIETNLSEEESLVGYFLAQQMNVWFFLLMGPLAGLTIKRYYVAVSDKGIHFHRVNLFEKMANSDFFTYEDIKNVKIGKGVLQRPMKFHFTSGRNIKLKAQLKGVAGVPKLTEEIQSHIENNVNIA